MDTKARNSERKMSSYEMLKNLQMNTEPDEPCGRFSMAVSTAKTHKDLFNYETKSQSDNKENLSAVNSKPKFKLKSLRSTRKNKYSNSRFLVSKDMTAKIDAELQKLEVDRPKRKSNARRRKHWDIRKIPKRMNPLDNRSNRHSNVSNHPPITLRRSQLEIISEKTEPTPLWSKMKHVKPPVDINGVNLTSDLQMVNNSQSSNENKSDNNAKNKPGISIVPPKCFRNKQVSRNDNDNNINKQAKKAFLKPKAMESDTQSVKSEPHVPSYMRNTSSQLAKLRSSQNSLSMTSSELDNNDAASTNSANHYPPTTFRPRSKPKRCYSTSSHDLPEPNKTTLQNPLPKRRKRWGVENKKRKGTKPKPFKLNTELRAQNVKSTRSESTDKMSQYTALSKKSTKMPTIIKEFKFRTEARSKRRNF